MAIERYEFRPQGRSLQNQPTLPVGMEYRIHAYTAPDLAIELQKIYDSEINLRIGWFWDGGIEIRLGDDINGYLAEETVSIVAEIVS